jgi:hypothetical protein
MKDAIDGQKNDWHPLHHTENLMTYGKIAALALVAGALFSCSSSESLRPGQGRISVRLTDAPLPLDEVESIDMFVVRIEAKAQATSEADADDDLEGVESTSNGWLVLATPNASFDLMDLRNGVSAFVGDAPVPAGRYHSMRLILDTQQSSVTLKDGTVLSGASSPSIVFPSAGKTGIKILFTTPIDVDADETTDVLVDFDAGESFVVRGNTILQNGLLFKPVIRATIQ